MTGAFDLARLPDQQCAIAVHFGIDGLSKFRRDHGSSGNLRRPARDQGLRPSSRGGWAGIGLAAGLTNPTDGLGAVGGYAALSDYTALGGSLTVWTLPAEK